MRGSTNHLVLLAMPLLLALVRLDAAEVAVATPEELDALAAEAREIVDGAIAEVATIVGKARAEVAEERADYREELDRAYAKYTRRGALEAAVAIKAELERLGPADAGQSANLLAAGAGEAEQPEGAEGTEQPSTAPPLDEHGRIVLPGGAARDRSGYHRALYRLAEETGEDILDECRDAAKDLDRLVRSLTRDERLEEAAATKVVMRRLLEPDVSPDLLDDEVFMPVAGKVARGDLALADRGATVEGTSAALIDGVTTGYTGDTGYAMASWPCTFTVDLGDAYTLRQVRMLLWDGNDRFYRYRIEVSLDGEEWATLADRGEGEWRSWQTIPLPRPTPLRFIRVHGLYNSANSGFHVVELEAYALPPRAVAAPAYQSSPP